MSCTIISYCPSPLPLVSPCLSLYSSHHLHSQSLFTSPIIISVASLMSLSLHPNVSIRHHHQ